MVNTEKENTMSELMQKLVERLAEMFPDQVYQSTLEAYIASKRPCDVFDVERLQREFSQEFKGFL